MAVAFGDCGIRINAVYVHSATVTALAETRFRDAQLPWLHRYTFDQEYARRLATIDPALDSITTPGNARGSCQCGGMAVE